MQAGRILQDVSTLQAVLELRLSFPRMNKDQTARQIQESPNMGACVVTHRMCLAAIWLLAVPRDRNLQRICAFNKIFRNSEYRL